MPHAWQRLGSACVNRAGKPSSGVSPSVPPPAPSPPGPSAREVLGVGEVGEEAAVGPLLHGDGVDGAGHQGAGAVHAERRERRPQEEVEAARPLAPAAVGRGGGGQGRAWWRRWRPSGEWALPIAGWDRSPSSSSSSSASGAMSTAGAAHAPRPLRRRPMHLCLQYERDTTPAPSFGQ